MKNDRRWLHVFAVAIFATFGVGANDMSIGCCGGGGHNYPYPEDAATDVAAVPSSSASATADAAPVDAPADAPADADAATD